MARNYLKIYVRREFYEKENNAYIHGCCDDCGGNDADHGAGS